MFHTPNAALLLRKSVKWRGFCWGRARGQARKRRRPKARPTSLSPDRIASSRFFPKRRTSGAHHKTLKAFKTLRANLGLSANRLIRSPSCHRRSRRPVNQRNSKVNERCHLSDIPPLVNHNGFPQQNTIGFFSWILVVNCCGEYKKSRLTKRD